MSDYTVHDEEDFARVYDEDEIVSIRKGDLRAVLDVASGSMDFGSGFLDNEQVEALRLAAVVLGIDPADVTPVNFECVYEGTHDWRWIAKPVFPVAPYWRCNRCSAIDHERPAP